MTGPDPSGTTRAVQVRLRAKADTDSSTAPSAGDNASRPLRCQGEAICGVSTLQNQRALLVSDNLSAARRCRAPISEHEHGVR